MIGGPSKPDEPVLWVTPQLNCEIRTVANKKQYFCHIYYNELRTRWRREPFSGMRYFSCFTAWIRNRFRHSVFELRMIWLRILFNSSCKRERQKDTGLSGLTVYQSSTKLMRHAHTFIYRYASPNDVSVNDEWHARRWSHNIIIKYDNIILYYNT